MAFNKIIIDSIKREIKKSLKIENRIGELISSFDEGCPPPSELSNLVNTKNQLVNQLNSTSSTLNLLNTLNTTLNTIITTSKLAINILLLIPIPTAPTPVPVSTILQAQKSIDTLNDLIDTIKGPLSIIPDSISTIQGAVSKTNNSLSFLDSLLENCITNELSIQNNQNLSEELNNLLSQGESDSGEDNQELLNRLQPNSSNPFIYKGFKFIIEYDPNNPLDIPRRRIKAIRETRRTKTVRFNVPPKYESFINENGQTETIIRNKEKLYSYSASLQVLIEEAKFVIDNSTNDLNIDLVPETPDLAENNVSNNSLEGNTTPLPPPDPSPPQPEPSDPSPPQPEPPNYSPINRPGSVQGEVVYYQGEYFQYDENGENVDFGPYKNTYWNPVTIWETDLGTGSPQFEPFGEKGTPNEERTQQVTRTENGGTSLYEETWKWKKQYQLWTLIAERKIR